MYKMSFTNKILILASITFQGVCFSKKRVHLKDRNETNMIEFKRIVKARIRNNSNSTLTIVFITKILMIQVQMIAMKFRKIRNNQRINLKK